MSVAQPTAELPSSNPMRLLLAFTAVYTVALFAYGAAVSSPLANLYTAITLGLFLLFAVLNRWARWPLHALWAVSLVGLGNMLGGVLLVDGTPLYAADLGSIPQYDKIFHLVATTAMFVVAWEAMKRWAGDGYHFGGLLLWTWLVAMGGGAVVEIAEYVGTLTAPVNVGGYENNVQDLIANAIGGAIGVVLVWRHERRSGVAKPS